jgi:transcriptional regulator with XRE-family HTH domain
MASPSEDAAFQIPGPLASIPADLVSGSRLAVEFPREDRWPREESEAAASSCGGAGRDRELSTAEALARVRGLSGLTWKQLARLFSMTRRSIHFWASGKPMRPANEEHLRRVLSVLEQVDRGDPATNRALLLTPRRGVVPLDVLAERRYTEFLSLVGPGPARSAPRPKPLSSEARRARRPLAPSELLGAEQDRIHRDVGRGRGVAVAGKKRGDAA